MASMQVFLSCSFEKVDEDIKNFFTSICTGLDIHCVNVDKGDPLIPPDKARELINVSEALIAIATRRTELKSGGFSMPNAVEQEIAMAYYSQYYSQKPILIFVENGVDISGFTLGYCTIQMFDREALWTPKFFEKAIASIYITKNKAIQQQQLGLESVFCENTKMFVELVDLSGSYTWRNSFSRELKFAGQFTEPIKFAIWASAPIKGDAQPNIFKWKCRFDKGTKTFNLTPVATLTNDSLMLAVSCDPKPQANDNLEFTINVESPYLNPIFSEDIPMDFAGYIINDIKYCCIEGLFPLFHTKHLKIHIQFPASIGLKMQDFMPFVGHLGPTKYISYLVESEMKRIGITMETFGGTLLIELAVESPLLGHFYGIAWNPQSKKETTQCGTPTP